MRMSVQARAECHVILDQWAPLPPQAALELLDGAFPDQKVSRRPAITRRFALQTIAAARRRNRVNAPLRASLCEYSHGIVFASTHMV